jgi:DNA-binding HxlR family transcriptional regulator
VLKDSYICSLALCMDLVGGKWKLVILWYLYHGPLRFSTIRRILSGITQKMLTQQLRELEKAGLVNRKVYPVVPPKVEYSLTEQALGLFPALDSLSEWGREYAVRHGIKRNPPELPPEIADRAGGRLHSSFDSGEPAG